MTGTSQPRRPALVRELVAADGRKAEVLAFGGGKVEARDRSCSSSPSAPIRPRRRVIDDLSRCLMRLRRGSQALRPMESKKAQEATIEPGGRLRWRQDRATAHGEIRGFALSGNGEQRLRSALGNAHQRCPPNLFGVQGTTSNPQRKPKLNQSQLEQRARLRHLAPARHRANHGATAPNFNPATPHSWQGFFLPRSRSLREVAA